MNKKIILLILAAGLSLMTACTNSANESNTAEIHDAAVVAAEAEENESEKVSYYKVELDNGTVIEIGAPAGDIVSLYGEPLTTAEAPSCIHEGVDTLYTFGGYTLTTSPDADGNAYIHEISLTSDAVAFSDGLTIGSEKAAVELTFGNNYTENFGVLSFDLGSVTASVVLDEDNCVSGITVTAK